MGHVMASSPTRGQAMPATDIVLAFLIVVLWGLNFVVMKFAITEIPPFLLTGVRFALAAVPAVFIVPRSKVDWRYLLVYGTGFGIVQFGFMFTAFRLGMPAGLAAVLLQTQAFLTIALAFLVLGERATRGQVVGIGIAAVGVAVVIAGAAQGATLLPVLLVMVAALGWGVANIALKLARPSDILSFTVWTSLVSSLPMFALSAATEGVDVWAASWAHLSWLGAAAVVYLAYPISLASGVIWGSLLSRYTAATFAPFALVVPVVAMAAGAFLYQERLSGYGLAGSALVLVGLAVLILAGRRAMKPDVS